MVPLIRDPQASKGNEKSVPLSESSNYPGSYLLRFNCILCISGKSNLLPDFFKKVIVFLFV